MGISRGGRIMQKQGGIVQRRMELKISHKCTDGRRIHEWGMGKTWSYDSYNCKDLREF